MIYFDHASTSFPKSKAMVSAIEKYCNESPASPGRGSYEAATTAARRLRDARIATANLIGSSNPDCIAFTTGATHSLNAAISGYISRGDHVVGTTAEHNSVLRPIDFLRRNVGIGVSLIKFTTNSHELIGSLNSVAQENTKLICITHGSNITGEIAPIEAVAEWCHQKNIALLLDVSQTAGAIPIGVDDLAPAFVCGTAHKALRGPSGCGFVYVAPNTRLRPILMGGGGHSSLSLIQPEIMPDVIEVGTVNYFGIWSLLSILNEKNSIERYKEYNYTKKQVWNLIERLRENPRVAIYSSNRLETQLPLFSFNIRGLSPSETCSELERRAKIAARCGLHCAPLMHLQIGTAPLGAVRISPGPENTPRDFAVLWEAITEIAQSASSEQSGE